MNSLVIARTPNVAGTIFEVASGGASFPVRVESEKGTVIQRLPGIIGWDVSFENPEMPLSTVIYSTSPNAVFYSPDGNMKGETSEARFSLMGKAIVKDESGRALGGINWKFKKHEAFSESGRRIGTFVHSPSSERKFIMPPSKAYLLERFEFQPETTERIDWRIVYAFIVQRIFSEKTRDRGPS